MFLILNVVYHSVNGLEERERERSRFMNVSSVGIFAEQMVFDTVSPHEETPKLARNRFDMAAMIEMIYSVIQTPWSIWAHISAKRK